jgi:hypothetical protein
MKCNNQQQERILKNTYSSKYQEQENTFDKSNEWACP